MIKIAHIRKAKLKPNFDQIKPPKAPPKSWQKP
jgi:hypothetical protein